MSKRKDKFENSSAWAAWLRDDIDGGQTSSNESSRALRKGVGGNEGQVSLKHDRPLSITGVPNRNIGLKSSILGPDDSLSSKPSMYRENSRSQQKTDRSGSREANREIVVNLALPRIRIPRIRIQWKQFFAWFVPISGVLLLVVAVPKIVELRIQNNKNTAAKITSLTPSYSPLKPEDSSASITETDYDSKRQLYRYNDEYSGVQLTISQQPLPNDLKENPSKIEQLASTIGAKEKIETTNGDAYISTDTKDATQRVVLAHRQLLIFILSSKTLSNSDWVEYIQSLE